MIWQSFILYPDLVPILVIDRSSFDVILPKRPRDIDISHI